MPSSRTYYRSFAGGEISPEMFGRLDDAKFQSGAARLRNCIVTPTGAAKNRGGFAYVNTTKNNGPARLIPFTYSLNQTMVIELGDGYARFHTNGETLQRPSAAAIPAFQPSGAVTCTIANPSVFTWVAHGMVTGQSVLLATTGPVPYPNKPSYPAGLGAGPYTVFVINANTFHLALAGTTAPVAVTAAAAHGGLAVEPDYAVGALVSYGGANYYRQAVPPTYNVNINYLDTDPANDGYWYAEPTVASSDGAYEIPTPYKAADLFAIHYAQSNDVMTLVHPNYAPAELSRLSATAWALNPIDFSPPLAAPLGVAVAASPGYLGKIATIVSSTNPFAATGGTSAHAALITTQANTTLGEGDGIYIANLTAVIGGVNTVMDNFYMVANVPADSSGDLIVNQLYVMDYSGNMLDSSGWSSYHATDGSQPISIQYGTKIFNITSLYAVQAIASDGISTSPLSGFVSVLNNLDVPGSFNTVSWDAVPNPSVAGVTSQSYNVYKQLNGLWGYIGNTQALSFVDNNIAPDMSITPGISDANFCSGPGYYPGAVCYFQQRRCFGGANSAPSNAWMSNSGTESMFDYSLPSLATDRISFQVAALQADIIQHLVPMLQLVLLTSESEFALSPGSTEAITPTNISVVPQSYIGASNVQPTVINTTMVYASARGGHVRELGYAWTVNGYSTGDLSLRAAHLFDNLTIVDQAYSKSPWPIVWFVSSSGMLLGLTYVPDQEIGAWHVHTTQGTFQSVACVAEGTQDVVYAVISRTINGQAVNYIERMEQQFFSVEDEDQDGETIMLPGLPLTEAFFVDAGITQTFTEPVSTIGGLTWLEGAKVAVLADGGVQQQKVVSGGSITLDHAATIVTVGLPYKATIKTLPAVMQLDGYGQGRQKNISRAWVKVYQSSGIWVGPTAKTLTEIRQRTFEAYGSPPALKSAELDVLTSPTWQAAGQTLIQQNDPLPFEVVGLTLEVAIGG